MAGGEGRAVLVTGGSRGIGRAIARAFAERGDRVAVHWGSSTDRAEQVLAELPGSRPRARAGRHGRRRARWARWSTGRPPELGGLDVLVNNAGVFTAHPPLTTSYEDWQAAWSRTLAVNLVGAANATFRAVPHLIAAGGGAVVNVSSRGAFRGEPNNPAYGASKAGLNAFAQSMALALAPQGISVTCVAPGLRADRDGPRGARRAGRGRRPGAVAVRPGGPAGGGRLGRAVAGLARRRGSPAAPIVDVNGASYLRS